MRPTANISYVEHSWNNSLKEFLAYVDGTIHIPPVAFLPWHPLRENDVTLMETLSLMDNVSRADLKACNRCGLHAGVVFLSEFTTADGISFSRDAWNGTQPRHSTLLWPYQPSPGQKSWQIWRRLLARAFLEDVPKQTSAKTKDLQLRQPLGAWLPNSDWLCQKWLYFYSPTTGHIYH
jgi:hypothetical protein